MTRISLSEAARAALELLVMGAATLALFKALGA